ncbi:MAG: hypothetical protein ABI462_05890 [Ignavibacteria bacterium]
MSDLNSNNPGKSMDNSGSNPYNIQDFELVSAYIDSEIKDEKEKQRIKDLIDTDNNYYNRYIFEKLAKQNLKKRSPRIETPVYIYKNIGTAIDQYIQKASVPTAIATPEIRSYTEQLNTQKSNLKRNLIYSSFAFVLLIAVAFLFNSILKKNPDLRENDLVSVSRNIFDKVESGQVKLQYQTNDANALSDSMNKSLDFKVFIPDVKDAILIGGVCNEINGQRVAHIIHKKGDTLIYTLQASLKDVMLNKDKIILCDEFKENIRNGENWFPCTKDKNRSVVIWVKENVVCSTVAAMDYRDIAVILTNYK